MPPSGNLKILSLYLDNFRNYSRQRFSFSGETVLLIGNNAVGKTSALEAISLVTKLKSFRTSRYEQLVKWESDKALVQAQIAGDKRDIEISLLVEDGKRIYTLNGKRKSIKDINGFLPAVSFTPDDLFLIKGSNEKRRAFVDDIGTQLSQNYYLVRSDYRKLVKQKSAALKNGESPSVIESINDVLAKVGAQFYLMRFGLLEKISPLVKNYFEEIVGKREYIGVDYQCSWCEGEFYGDKKQAEEALHDTFQRIRSTEQESGHVLVGPHKDGITFQINGENAQQYASQGQQRSIVLACKLAEIAFINQSTGQRPVLLLDDVMSELDKNRRSAFMRQMGNTTQTFISATNLEYFSDDIAKNSEIIRL